MQSAWRGGGGPHALGWPVALFVACLLGQRVEQPGASQRQRRLEWGDAAVPFAWVKVSRLEAGGGISDDEERAENEDGSGEELDDHVEGGPGGVLERVADGVAGDGRLVRL